MELARPLVPGQIAAGVGAVQLGHDAGIFLGVRRIGGGTEVVLSGVGADGAGNDSHLYQAQ